MWALGDSLKTRYRHWTIPLQLKQNNELSKYVLRNAKWLTQEPYAIILSHYMPRLNYCVETMQAVDHLFLDANNFAGLEWFFVLRPCRHETIFFLDSMQALNFFLTVNSSNAVSLLYYFIDFLVSSIRRIKFHGSWKRKQKKLKHISITSVLEIINL